MSFDVQYLWGIWSFLCGLHNVTRKLFLGTRRKWLRPRPRRQPPKTETTPRRLQFLSRRDIGTRRRDRETTALIWILTSLIYLSICVCEMPLQQFCKWPDSNQYILIGIIIIIIIVITPVCYRYALETAESSVFTHASDCWMYAVVLWEFFSLGADPWPCETQEQVLV